MTSPPAHAWDKQYRVGTNYRLKDGDVVQLLATASVDGYLFDPATNQSTWDRMCVLAGTSGIVAIARTPRVCSVKGESLYFANVDVQLMGETLRIRVPHRAVRRVPNKAQDNLQH